MNNLLYKAVHDFNADIVVPIDADEFLTSDKNPKEILSKLDDNYYYKVKWKTYVPSIEDDSEELFIPKRITYIRDESVERYYKVIVPAKMVLNNAQLTNGNHDLAKSKFKSRKLSDLKLAHFPLRSKEQAISKVLIGYLLILAKDVYTHGEAKHWKSMFDSITKNKDFTNDIVTEFAKKYAVDYKTKKEISIFKCPINLDFCDNIEIKYTKRDFDLLNNLIDNYGYLALKYRSLRKNQEMKQDKIKNKLYDVVGYLYKSLNR